MGERIRPPELIDDPLYYYLRYKNGGPIQTYADELHILTGLSESDFRFESQRIFHETQTRINGLGDESRLLFDTPEYAQFRLKQIIAPAEEEPEQTVSTATIDLANLYTESPYFYYAMFRRLVFLDQNEEGTTADDRFVAYCQAHILIRQYVDESSQLVAEEERPPNSPLEKVDEY